MNEINQGNKLTYKELGNLEKLKMRWNGHMYNKK